MSETIIHLSDVNVYQAKNLILANVNLEVEKGEFVYLIGKTGSGKTSLLKILYADIDLEQGDATVAGFHLNHMKHSQIPFLRRKLGIVFQDFQLLSDRTVNDNLFFVLKATGWKATTEMQARVQEVLDMVGLSTKGFKMPHELSGGEQQRLVIARALLNHPDLILADEPTGNLDPETSEGIMKLLFDISRTGRAVIMATHNYPLIDKYPARILKCENGKLIDSKNSVAALN
jgi:cell division transport system ATP-binding protein